MSRLFSIKCGFCLCIACLCILFGWGALSVEKGWSSLTKRPSKEKWIVVVSVSEGFDSMFQNWWVWFRKLNLDMEVFLVAEDYKTMQKYNSSTELHMHQGMIDRNMASDKALNFASYNYMKMMTRRGRYILHFLQKNYSLIFTDIDTVWLKDPTPYFKGDFDMWGLMEYWAQPSKTEFCMGFFAIKPTEASKQIIQQWNATLSKSAERNKPLNDQIVFNDLMLKNENNKIMKIMHLPSKQFKTGNNYDFTKPPPPNIVLVHNNWIKGLANKTKRFKTSGLWTQI